MLQPEATVCPFIFELDVARLGDYARVVRFTLPQPAYRRIRELQQVSHNASLQGLEVMLAWVAPEVDLVSVDRPANSNEKTIVLDMLMPATTLEVLQDQVRLALDLWLGVTLEEKAGEVQALLDDKRTARRSWTEWKMATAVDVVRGTAHPKDQRIFDLITLLASRLIATQATEPGSDAPVFLQAGAAKSLFHGKQLVRFPPYPGQRHGFWTETLRVFSMTTPEQPRLRIGVHPGIRNYVGVAKPTGYRDPRRTLDVFIPAAGARSRDVKRRWVPVPVRYDRGSTEREVKLREGPSLRTLKYALTAVGQSNALAEFRGAPLVDGDVYLLPRGGAGHGDRWMPGGTGVGTPDRVELLQRLSTWLAKGGFEPIPALNGRRSRHQIWSWTRPLKQVALDGPKSDLDASRLRRCVAHAVTGGDGSAHFSIAYFWQRPNPSEPLQSAIANLLGPPDVVRDNTLQWNDGLTIHLRYQPAESLSREIELDVAIPEGLSTDQQRKVRDAAWLDLSRRTEKQLCDYVGASVDGAAGPVVGILEQVSTLQGSRGDPYLLAQKAFAHAGCPVQVLLWSADGMEATELDEGDKEDDLERSKLRSSLLDLFRCLGVSPRAPKRNRSIERLQGWWIVNTTADDSRQPGAYKEAYLTPVCIESSLEAIRAAVLLPDGSVSWMPYSQAVACLSLRTAENLSGRNWMEQAVAIERFFDSCLSGFGSGTVFCEAANIRKYVRGLSNGAMQLGRLELGAVGRTTPTRVVTDGGDVNIVRIALEPGRSPGYVVSGRKLGFAQGAFSEKDARRTYWVMRGLPVSLQKSARLRKANRASRHAQGPDAQGPLVSADRRLPSLSEVCVVAVRDGLDPVELADVTRLCMRTHITSNDELLLPFPLHEASALGDHAR